MNIKNFDFKSTLPAFPKWVRYRQEKNAFITIFNLKADRIYYMKDPFGIDIKILSLLSKGDISVEELFIALGIRKQAIASFLIRFIQTIFQKAINEEENINGEENKIFTLRKIPKNKLPKLIAPLAIELLVTYQCNSQCRHCLVGDYRYSNESDMPLDYIKKIAYQANESNIYKIILTGGESIARKDFFDVMDILSVVPSIEIATNGLLLNENIVKRLNKYPVSRYIISLEGASAKIHEFIRGKGSFKKTLKGIKNLRKLSKAYGIEVKVACGKHNIFEIEKIINLCINLGIEAVEFGRLNPWGWGRALSNYCISGKSLFELDQTIKEMKEKYKGCIIIEGDALPSQFRDSCGIGAGFAIQPNGNVLPCRIFELAPTKEVILGNIAKQKLLEIWNSSKAKNMKNYVDSLAKSAIACKMCKFYNVCSFPHCLARAFISSPNQSLQEAIKLSKCPGPN